MSVVVIGSESPNGGVARQRFADASADRSPLDLNRRRQRSRTNSALLSPRSAERDWPYGQKNALLDKDLIMGLRDPPFECVFNILLPDLPLVHIRDRLA